MILRRIHKSYFSIALILILIFFLIFNFYLFLEYALTYLQNDADGILSASALKIYQNSNFFKVFYEIIKNIPYRFISLLGFRASMANNYNIFIDYQNGYLISKNIFLTNILPALLYIPFNSYGLWISFQSKILRPYLIIILPSVVPCLFGFCHMRYFYPAVPVISMAWSILFSNYLIKIIDKNNLKLNLNQQLKK